ncbi:MAG: phosphatase PAP2 family protein [Thiohalocapsa sp.]
MLLMWRYLTDFGDTAMTVPLAVLTTGVLAATRQQRLALAWGAVILACAGVTGALKLSFRVCGYPLGASMMSASGHTAMSIAVYGGIAVVVGSTLGPAARAALSLGTAVFTLGIAVSRTIAGFHTPLEVVVGFGVGLAALLAAIVAVRRWRPAELPLGWLLAGALVVFLVFHGTRWPAEQAIGYVSRWLELLRPLCT